MATKQFRSYLLIAAILGIALFIATSAHAQFAVRTAVPTSNTPFFGIVPDNIVAAEVLFDPANNASISGYTNYSFINFDGSGTDVGQFLNGNPFPNNLNNTDYFALEALATISFASSGDYVFRVNSDDGFRLRFGTNPDGSGGTTYSEAVFPRGPANTDGIAMHFDANTSLTLRLTYFEQAGGEELELSYSQNGSPFALVTGRIGQPQTNAAPEPGTLALVIIGALPLAGILLRRNHICGIYKNTGNLI